MWNIRPFLIVMYLDSAHLFPSHLVSKIQLLTIQTTSFIRNIYTLKLNPVNIYAFLVAKLLYNYIRPSVCQLRLAGNAIFSAYLR